MKPETLRQDFPALQQQVYQKPLVYLDNGATTLKPQVVIDRVEHYYRLENANVHRGVHYLSQQATTAMEEAREYIKSFIGASSSHEIIFTKGTTEAINLLAFAYGEAFVQQGDEIVLSVMEHHANIVPWQQLCRRKGAILKVIPCNEQGELDVEAYQQLLSSKTRLVAYTHISNVLGTINPVKEMADMAHDAGAHVMVDGAQGIAHKSVNVKELGCDFYVFSGHKIFAPMGIGVLYGKEDLLEKMPPYQTGGEMIDRVSFEHTTFNTLPFKFEAGTPNVGGILGLESALKYVAALNLEAMEQHESDLLRYATEALHSLGSIRIIGQAAQKTSVLSFIIDGLHHYDVGTLIDKMGVAVRTGHHCAQPLMHRFGLEGTIRASFSIYNNRNDVDLLINALQRAIRMLT